MACSGVALVVASMTALNTALGDIAVATSATQTQLTWVVDGYTLVLACLLLPAGAIGDRYGRRGALLTGLAVFSVASIAPLVFDSPVQIIGARAAAGLGAAFIMPATLSLLTAAYPPADRTKAVGIWAGVAGSGGALGMLGSGALLHFWSWQSIFWALSGAAVLLFVLTCTVSSSRVSDAPPVDWPGAALIGAAVALFVFGILEAPTRGWTDPVVYGSIAAGLAFAVLFGFVELRRPHPLLDVRVFADAGFATGAATIVVFFAANLGLFYLLVQHLQLVKGYSPIATAFAISPLMVGIVSLSALSFWYLPKLGLRAVLFTGLLLISVGFFLLHGVGAGLVLPRSTVAVAGAVRRHRIDHRPSDIGDHGSRSGQQAGCRIGGERRRPRDRRRARHRRRRIDSGRRLHRPVTTCARGVPRIGARTGVGLAGAGAGCVEHARPPGASDSRWRARRLSCRRCKARCW